MKIDKIKDKVYDIKYGIKIIDKSTLTLVKERLKRFPK